LWPGSELDGKDLRRWPIKECKTVLAKLPSDFAPKISLNEHLEEDGIINLGQDE
jgi:hypothetical protein